MSERDSRALATTNSTTCRAKVFSMQERQRLTAINIRMALENERGFRLEDKALLIQEKKMRLVQEYELTRLKTNQTRLLSQIEDLEIQIATLEAKGEKEVEAHSKRTIVHETRIKELEFEVEQRIKEVKGGHKKVTKLEAALLEAQEQVEQTTQELELARSETLAIEKKATEWERKAEQLKLALEVEKVRVTELQKPVKRDSTPSNTASSVSEESASEEPKPSRSRKPKKTGSSKDNLLGKKKREKLTRALRKAESVPQSSKEPESDVRFNKPINTRRGAEYTGQVDHNEPEVSSGSQLKRKAEDPIPPAYDKLPEKRLRKDGPSLQKNAETEAENDQPAKKKRRKLASRKVYENPPGFSFAETEAGALDIPSVLSPVKEGQQVPPRFGTLGSMLRF